MEYTCLLSTLLFLGALDEVPEAYSSKQMFLKKNTTTGCPAHLGGHFGEETWMFILAGRQNVLNTVLRKTRRTFV